MPRHLDEESLEALIVEQMTADGVGWNQGDPQDFDPSYCLSLPELARFLKMTQPVVATSVGIARDGSWPSSEARTKFLHRLEGEITKNGVVHVLRKGFGHQALSQIDFYYPIPTQGNVRAAEQHQANQFTITQQVHFSPVNRALSIDLVAFINGIPVVTFELKNWITKQTVEDAVQQYKTDRSPKELLFQMGRCIAHFAVDDKQVKFCTTLAGQQSWFLPFDQGYNDGAGNPVNPDGVMTDYLWKQILAPQSLSDIIENYAQILTEKDLRTGKKSSKAIFPRYHQLDVVRKLLADISSNGVGRRYLIQHSAGSGKSNSIAWLARQLTEVKYAGELAVDSVLVVTDRVVLDNQISATIKGFTQVGSTVAHAGHSSELREAIEAGKRIIITTVQKFPYIVDSIGNEHRDRKFAVIIDEAHSSQSGKAAAALAGALSTAGAQDDQEDPEDIIARLAEQRKLPPNAAYFAFTATPKNKTLELFGQSVPGLEAKKPFHAYSMKQAIEEGFILDVLAHFVYVDSYYKLMKTIDEDPQFDAKKAASKLRRYVEGHETAVRRKAEIMVDHFHEQVIAKKKIGGQARAMVVTDSIARAIDYYTVIRDYLVERGSPYKAIVAFSDFDRDGVTVTEAQYNGFPGKDIPERIREDPYRFLIAADKYQTGYDEPLLHTMYVDKHLSGVKAVQTLSRLNRAMQGKRDVMVLDFANKPEDIEASFAPYYRTTVLSGDTDPDKLHTLQADLAGFGVYTPEMVEHFVGLLLSGANRDQLDPILDRSVAEYTDSEMSEDEQVEFKSKAKSFVRTYSFLSLVLPFTNTGWEKLSMFLGFLIPKLPAPREDDFSAGILDAIDMESYRIEKREEIRIGLADEDGQIEPVPIGSGGGKLEPDMTPLSVIITEFNNLWGDIPWEDPDRVLKRITEEIPKKVLLDKHYVNAMANNDETNARIALTAALSTVMVDMLADETQLFKYFADNQEFKHWLTGVVFRSTYDKKSA
ncbi:MAG: type I restriction endonuclease [Propionibacteriaceae bacterium]|nr:type I restriction endonuclease [Propionibacteriaceae bacterium]